MSECSSIRDLLVVHAEGLLSASEGKRVAEHLTVCAGCRAEAQAMDTVREWLSDPAIFAPPQTSAWQALPERLAAVAQVQRRSWLPLDFGSAGWALSLAATVVIGFVLIHWTHSAFLTKESTIATGQSISAPGNEAFLDRIYVEHARLATSRYLAACQDLLLSTLRAEASCEQSLYDVSAEVAQARELLSRKRLLDPELNAPEVAHARGLCDELEGFLLNLSLSEKCETRDKMRRLEHYVQKQQLLLRIRVIQGELS